MDLSATQSKAAKPTIYNSKEDVFVVKRTRMNRLLAKVDSEQLVAILNKPKQ